jgi:uncharacterized protein (DUF2147 family)
MKKMILVVLCCCLALSVEAQTIFGKWQSINSKTGNVDGTIEIYKENNKAYAKIIEISNPADRDKICIYCKGANKNKPILGLTILEGLKENGDEWSGGKIVDPRNGNSYKCYIKLKDNNTLKLRGYIGISLFGRTEYWRRLVD